MPFRQMGLPAEIVDNTHLHRFELVEHGEIVFANYRLTGDRCIIPHVEAPLSLRGTGAAARLMEGVVALARVRGLTLVPTCSYARAWFRRHPDAADVLA